jgi:histidine triad (HIT) family protein
MSAFTGLLRFARTRAGRYLVRFLFSKMTFAIPAERLRETATLLAFYHPRPAYPRHIVLVPRTPVATLLDLSPDDPFLPDLLRTVQSLVDELQLPAYRLVVNGGAYQDFPHLHFHLVSDAPDAKPAF